MININSLHPIVKTKLIADPFNYLPYGQSESIIIPEYSAMVLEKAREKVIQILPNDYGSLKQPFYLQHYDLFTYAQELFSYLFGNQPDIRIYEYHRSYKVSLFLFFKESFIEKAGRKEEIIIRIDSKKLPHRIKWFEDKLSDEYQLGIQVDNIRIEKDAIYFTFPKGYYPVIGGLNSLDSGWRTPNFNLVFGTEYDKFFDNERNYDRTKNKYQNQNDDFLEKYKNFDYDESITDNIDPYFIKKGLNGLALYSIDKYNFKNDEKLKDYYFHDPKEYFEFAIKRAAEDFIITMFDFLLAINRAKYLPIDKYEFSATMPHFYGIDRTQSSVKLWDAGKKWILKNMYDQAEKFGSIYGTDLNCKHFVDYFIKDSFINFEKLKTDPAKEILKAFKNQPQIPLLLNPKFEIFSRHITNKKPNEDYKEFLNGPKGQLNAKKDIEHLL